MKNDISEMLDQINEMIDPMLLMAQRMYQKMGDNTDMWKDLAKCYKTAVDVFVDAGFSREEAIRMAIGSLNNFGKK